MLGPAYEDNRSIGFQLPTGTDWVLIAADETALPAAAAILEWLPSGLRARAWIEVPSLQDTQKLLSPAEADITRLVRDPLRRPGTLLVEEIRDTAFPGVRGIDRRLVEFSGYWRLGATEEELRTEKIREASAGGGAGTGTGTDD